MATIWDMLSVASEDERITESFIARYYKDEDFAKLDRRQSVTSEESNEDFSLAGDGVDTPENSQFDADSLSMICDSITIESIAMKTLSIGEESENDDNTFNVVHEGTSTKIVCFRDPTNKFDSRSGSVAIKSLNDEFPDEEQIVRLQNEFTISKHLMRCSAVRAALSQTELNGIPSLLLEWAPGDTLRKWARSAHNADTSLPLAVNTQSALICVRDMKIILQVAWNIARALAEIHEAGVTHNNLSPDKIIIDDRRNNDIIPLKIIGLGSASFLTDASEASSKSRKDLQSLGLVYFEMFTGRSPFNKSSDHDSFSDDEGNESQTLLSQNQLISILTSRLPLVLAKLTLDLMEAKGSSHRFQSARDVDREMYVVIANLESIMSNSTHQSSLGQLQFPHHKIYGRDSHLKALMDSCSKIGKPDGSKMVLVSGYSGAGKSTLVKHVERPLKEKGIHFVSGKFEKLQQAKPLSALDAAFAEYCEEIVNQGQQEVSQIRKSIIEAINTDIGVLTEAFPSLRKLIGEPTTAPTEVHFMAAQNRFKFIFQMFVRAIANSSHPLVLFLDDLQWADELSLRLISTLVTDTENSCFLFIGSYRDNEVGASDPLAIQLNELEMKQVRITSISVSSISKEDVNKFISDTISMPQSLTKSLSGIVYQKTGGNALLVAQFLQTLCDEDLLLFSLDSNTWGWDSEAINAKEIPDNVGVLLSGKILQLPRACQYAMKLLACVGSKCDESTLRLILGEDKGLEQETSGVKRQRSTSEEDHQFLMLDFAVDEGLLKKEGSNYMFVHDQIQQAAYSIIPENERGSLHKRIGCLILGNVAEDKFDDVLFTAVNQLNQGRIHLKTEEQRLDLLKLNLRAGQKAVSMAAFSIAASYLKTGVNLFCDGHWEKYYDLSLELYSLYSEVEYCICHFQEVGRVAGIVIKCGKSFKDKLRIYATLIKALGVENKLQDAINICFSVLSELGVNCASPVPDRSDIMNDWMKMKKKLEEMTDVQFLNYKEMSDSNMLAAMKFLHLLILYTFFSKQELFPTIIIKMMQLTLQHGVCKESCVALGSCSYLLCEFQDFKGAEHIGRLSTGLLEKLKAQEYLSQVYLCVYSGIHSWIKNVKLSLEPIMCGYQAGMQIGDIQHAMLNASTYVRNSFIAGQNLIELEKNIETFGKQMIEYKQPTVYQMMLPMKQAVTDLVSSTDDLSSVSEKSEEQKSLLEQAIAKNITILISDMYIFGGIVAYIFGDYKLAVALVQKRHELEKQMSRTNILFGMTAFYDGLIFLAMAHESSDFDYTEEVSKVMAKMESFVQIGKDNCEHKLLLLEAEIKSRMGEKEGALEKYNLAIAVAERNEFIHEQAIANERAAYFFLRNRDSKTASRYYGKAHSLYLEWGAQSKADHLCKNIPF